MLPSGAVRWKLALRRPLMGGEGTAGRPLNCTSLLMINIYNRTKTINAALQLTLTRQRICPKVIQSRKNVRKYIFAVIFPHLYGNSVKMLMRGCIRLFMTI